jgi:hypothetical protein
LLSEIKFEPDEGFAAKAQSAKFIDHVEAYSKRGIGDHEVESTRLLQAENALLETIVEMLSRVTARLLNCR